VQLHNQIILLFAVSLTDSPGAWIQSTVQRLMPIILTGRRLNGIQSFTQVCVQTTVDQVSCPWSVLLFGCYTMTYI